MKNMKQGRNTETIIQSTSQVVESSSLLLDVTLWQGNKGRKQRKMRTRRNMRRNNSIMNKKANSTVLQKKVELESRL